MRCHICDKILDPGEIALDKRTNEFKPCEVCLNISMETLSGYDIGYVSDEEIEEYLTNNNRDED